MQIPPIAPENNTTDRTQITDTETLPTNPDTTKGFPLLLNTMAPEIVKPKLPAADLAVQKTSDQSLDDDSEAQAVNPLAVILLTQLELVNNQPQAAATMEQTNAPQLNPAPAPIVKAQAKGLLPESELSVTPVKENNPTADSNNLLGKMTKDKLFVEPVATENVKPHTATPVLPTVPVAADNQPAAIIAQPVPVVVQKEQVDKGVNALMQLGQMINSHTQALSKTEINASQLAETDYAKTARRVGGPEFETKIELQQSTLDNVLKNTINANIKIYPPELGHVLAKLKMDKDSTELLIMTENNAVKQIVEANLPQLRQSFLQADINLTHVEVQSFSAQEKAPEQQSNNHNNQLDSNALEGELASEEPTSQTPAKSINSLVDTYA